MFDLGQLHKEFINQQRYLRRLSEVTLRGYEQSFALLQEVMPELKLPDLTTKSVAEFFRRLDTRPRIVGRGIKKVGIKKSTAATYRSKLNRFFEWLEKTGHIKQNPFSLIRNFLELNIYYL